MSGAGGLGGFADRPHTRGRGEVGEEAGVAWLVAEGYRPVERNARNAAGEIDLVAWEGETLCFVEIKARSSEEYGAGIEAVTPPKQRRIARAAALWLAERDLWEKVPCRFDVLGVDRDERDGWIFTLVRDAFEAG